MNDIIKQNVKITVNDIVKFEIKHNIQLPNDYKVFLLKYNGGYPKYSTFKISKEGESLVNKFYGIGNMSMNLSQVFDINDGEIPDGFISIADDPGGNEIMIGISGKNINKVYFSFHDIEDSEENRKGIFIANSFDEFFHMLY